MTINKFNYESFALDYLEGTLSPEMAEEMERFLKTHPAIEAELSGMMELIVLAPDTSIVYEGKADLLKEEKVVWLSRKWVRPLMAAASILLLLTTFFVGYRAGLNRGETIVVVEDDNKDNDPEVMVNKEVELPKVEKIALEKIEKIVPQKAAKVIVKNTKQSEKVNYTIALPKSTYVKEEVVEEKSIKPLQLIDNEMIVEVGKKEVETQSIQKGSNDITFIETKIVAITINPLQESNLEKALQTTILIDDKVLANYQKRKRSFKDLLGRFPVSNLKEALIPSYYKEEMAGQ